MAKDKSDKRKPRIRKTAPTVRELAESSSQKAERPAKKGPVKRFFRIIVAPFRWVFAADKPLGKLLRRIARPLKWVARKIVPKYFINSWRELKQVTWPGRVETWRLTAAVFVFATVFGAVIYGVDMALDRIFKETVLR